jgi:NADH dehydrogenase FAD-containing subunit
MTEPVRRLLLVGAGHAHLGVLASFAHKPPPAGCELLLLSPSPRGLGSALVPGVVAGRFEADKAFRALAPMAADAGVRLVEGRAVSLDAAARCLTLADGSTLAYDLLSLDIGSRLDREAVAGAREHALALRPSEPFMALQAALAGLAAERPVDLLVIGGGADAVELALALAARTALPARPSRDGLAAAGSGRDDRARVALACGAGGPLKGYPPGVVARVRQALARCRVTVFPERVLALDGRQAHLASGARLACDGAVLATGPRPWPWLAGSGLALADDGFIATRSTLQSLSHPEVFAAGSCATRDDQPRPVDAAQGAVQALRAGPALAANLRRVLAGEPPRPWTPPRQALQALATGGGRAIVVWGGRSFEGRLAGWWKDRRDRAWLAGWAAAGGRAGAVVGEGMARPLASDASQHTGHEAENDAVRAAGGVAWLNRPAGS